MGPGRCKYPAKADSLSPRGYLHPVGAGSLVPEPLIPFSNCRVLGNQRHQSPTAPLTKLLLCLVQKLPPRATPP